MQITKTVPSLTCLPVAHSRHEDEARNKRLDKRDKERQTDKQRKRG